MKKTQNSKAHMNMNMNTRTPKSTYMKIQVRTIHFEQKKKTKKTIQNQSVNIQDNQENYE